MSVERSCGRARWSGDADARLFYARVSDACPGGEHLPTCLEASLRAALEMLAGDPELAHLLTVQPYLDGEEVALAGHREWIGRLGELLRDAAARDPRASREPSFLVPFLIGGVRFQIARLVLSGEGHDLLRLLPGTLEALLAYWFEPGEPSRLARAALAAHG
jgi:hypothetical protein